MKARASRTLHASWMVAAALAGCFVFACSTSDTDGSSPTSSDAAVDSAVPDAASPDDADAAPDARGPFDAEAPPVTCSVTPCITKIVAGPNHYCAVSSEGVVWCWGDPNALGNFAPKTSPAADRGAKPVLLAGVADVVDLGATLTHTCVLHSDGGVDCFGRGSAALSRVARVAGAKRLAVGDSRSCVVDGNDQLTCWGDSFALGNGQTTMDAGGEKAASVAMSDYAAFVVGMSGSVYSWGFEKQMLGRTTSLGIDWTPDRVEVLPATLQLAASTKHVCAITIDGRLFCWGHGDQGALGVGNFQDMPLPTEVGIPGPAFPAQIAVSGGHSCARTTNGRLYCWSRANTYGELGYEDVAGVFVPALVSSMENVVSVATGTGSTCALSTSGVVQCWGDNSKGQLGIGQHDSQRHPTPTAVAFP
ncbi:hypothetical protein AKJ09_01556 [Labilithrix luteola]|uniref:BNR repeat domain protein n=1 Tax=Labilithrix luteola TaxID=1391654 RepID=A0A0K1PN00_9BACT|nr:hypothetical protein [Labilithrix luteola]AKU94892.1 hypothetical protein AKJ09_01556 [Labilithrix luteola]